MSVHDSKVAAVDMVRDSIQDALSEARAREQRLAGIAEAAVVDRNTDGLWFVKLWDVRTGREYRGQGFTARQAFEQIDRQREQS